ERLKRADERARLRALIVEHDAEAQVVDGTLERVAEDQEVEQRQEDRDEQRGRVAEHAAQVALEHGEGPHANLRGRIAPWASSAEPVVSRTERPVTWMNTSSRLMRLVVTDTIVAPDAWSVSITRGRSLAPPSARTVMCGPSRSTRRTPSSAV